MDELLFYAKLILLIVLIYDVVILFRKPEDGSKVVTLDFWKEMERKGINGTLYSKTLGSISFWGYLFLLPWTNFKFYFGFVLTLFSSLNSIEEN